MIGMFYFHVLTMCRLDNLQVSITLLATGCISTATSKTRFLIFARMKMQTRLGSLQSWSGCYGKIAITVFGTMKKKLDGALVLRRGSIGTNGTWFKTCSKTRQKLLINSTKQLGNLHPLIGTNATWMRDSIKR
jgi:hypothetical protein